MARGRMLNGTVTESIKFHRLPDDTCRLMATWTISLLDAYGVFHADPVLVKSRIFPMRTDISVEQVAKYIDAMEVAGLIKRFEHGGRSYQYWPGFKDNQPKLHQDREGSSGFPKPPADEAAPKANGAAKANNDNAPKEQQQIGAESCDSSPELVRSNSGVTPPQSNISESKLRELGAGAPREISINPKTATVADATQPKPQDNVSSTGTAPVDFLDDALARLEKQAGNADAKSEAIIRRWDIPPHLTDICIEFVRVAHVPVMQGDKGKWAKGAKDLHELGAQPFMQRAFIAGKKDGLNLTWPGALTELCRNEMAHQSPERTERKIIVNGVECYLA